MKRETVAISDKFLDDLRNYKQTLEETHAIDNALTTIELRFHDFGKDVRFEAKSKLGKEVVKLISNRWHDLLNNKKQDIKQKYGIDVD